ncbi:hypothetical protein Zmor_016391 [Zophobas morio]|uniref:BEACH domain-containing protein n=1 Tax=Zophobas morio TaxID=2755281 RepID=A0AA38LYK3_9CUCU|nr:hypothetical protein Zmor_016391 [Zophobas morio]
MNKFGFELAEKPYFYGSHYSSAASVLYFLVRVQPFSDLFRDLQGGKFDLPDRMFHSVGHSWLISSELSSSDVKELIPEFYYLPDMFINSQSFRFGEKQNGEIVNDVILPPWAKGDPRLFVMLHRQALESDYVTLHLPEWLDLIFGYKQRGPSSVTALNVFHPLTYEGNADLDEIDDDIRLEAMLAQIRSYGQTPIQLFCKPHVHPSVSRASLCLESVGAG